MTSKRGTMYLLVKTLVTAVIVVAVSELARRYSLFAALLASLPLTSLLAFIWIYVETKDAQKVAELSQSIFWLVIPSLTLFIVLPLLLQMNLNFWLTLAASCAATAAVYGVGLLVWKSVH